MSDIFLFGHRERDLPFSNLRQKSIKTITEYARKCDYSYDLNIRQGRCSNVKSVVNNNVSCIPTIVFS